MKYQRLQLRCGDCRALFDGHIPVECSVDIAVAAMTDLRCATCGSKKVLLGQDRTFEEDRAKRNGSSYADRVFDWLVSGEVGESSRAIHAKLSGRAEVVDATPHDASDLVRCMLLLDRIPEWRDRMGEMSSVSPGWAAFAAGWPELEAAFAEDDGGSAARTTMPRTSAVVQALVQASRNAPPAS